MWIQGGATRGRSGCSRNDMGRKYAMHVSIIASVVWKATLIARMCCSIRGAESKGLARGYELGQKLSGKAAGGSKFLTRNGDGDGWIQAQSQGQKKGVMLELRT